MPFFVDPLRNNTFRVIDGDTVECFLDRGWKETKTVSLRLAGLDTPENKNTRLGGLKEKEAGTLVAKVVVEWLIARRGSDFYHTSDAKPKYAFRTVGRLIAGWPSNSEADECLNDFLLTEGLARPYQGGTKRPWTKEQLDSIIAKAKAILGEAE